MQLGAMYCRIPTVESFKRRVPKLKNSRGTAVTSDDATYQKRNTAKNKSGHGSFRGPL